MARAPDPIARFLAQSEHSPLTIKNYRSDLDAFAAWFEGANGDPALRSSRFPWQEVHHDEEFHITASGERPMASEVPERENAIARRTTAPAG